MEPCQKPLSQQEQQNQCLTAEAGGSYYTTLSGLRENLAEKTVRVRKITVIRGKCRFSMQNRKDPEMAVYISIS